MWMFSRTGAPLLQALIFVEIPESKPPSPRISLSNPQV
jgi:hypothetical protein